MAVLTVVDFLRNTKVGNFDTALVIDQDICTLDITMDDVPFV